MFRDDELMIVDSPTGRRRYEFRDGRVEGVYPD